MMIRVSQNFMIYLGTDLSHQARVYGEVIIYHQDAAKQKHLTKKIPIIFPIFLKNWKNI